MNFFQKFSVPFQAGICYSGFRNGQQPGGIVPTYQEIKEDLLILQPHWMYIRLYDVDEHAQTVLQVIRKEQLPFKVMLGAYITAEQNNPNCPWAGGTYSSEVLEANKILNQEKIDRLISWANAYQDIVFTLSVGNEACVDWTDHLVPVQTVVQMVKKVKQQAKQPVTFCENYVPWLHHLQPLAEVIDFISIHTYPVWEYKNIHEAIAYTEANYRAVAQAYPNKPVVITEAGWATQSNGRGIPPENVNEHLQKIYFDELAQWTVKHQVLCFYFEAFDENWKGSEHPLEPEKHWGIFTAERMPKLAMQHAFTGMASMA